MALLKPLAEIAVILSSLAFIAGWSYLFSYFNYFGLGLFEYDIPFSVASVFAIRVFFHSPWPTVVIIVAGLLIAGRKLVARLLGRNSQYEPQGGSIAALCLVALVVVLALTSVQVGHQSASADMYSDTTQLPNVAFISSLKTDQPLPSCVVENDLQCLLLLHTKGFYYVFEPIQGKPEGQISQNVRLYVVPESVVQVARIQRGVQ